METKQEPGLQFALTGADTPRLSIDHINGDLTITGWDQPSIRVTTGDDDEDAVLAEALDATQQGNEVKIGLGVSQRQWWKRFSQIDVDLNNIEDLNSGLANLSRALRQFGKGFNVSLQVRVPHTCDITVRSASGEMTLKQIEGNVYLQSASGDLTLHEIRGNVLAKTMSGDVQIRDLQGRLGARSASGNVEVENSNLAALSIGTVSGDLEIDAALQPGGEYEVQTVSGDLKLAIPANTQAVVDFETISGDVSCRLPHRVERRGRRNRTLEINGGGDTRLRVRTTSGDLTIKSGNTVGAPVPVGVGAPAATAAEAPPAETRRFSAGEVAAASTILSGEGEHARASAAASAAASTGDDAEGGHTQRLDAQAAPRGGSRQSPEMTILEAIENGEMSVDEGLRRLTELAE